jgi:hypothetical protein
MWFCGRSVFRGRPGRRALAAGSIREPTANHRRDDGRAREMCRGSSCGGDHLLAKRRGLDRCERLVAELAQDVEGAAAELARDRRTGAVVVDPPRHLPVVLRSRVRRGDTPAGPLRTAPYMDGAGGSRARLGRVGCGGGPGCEVGGPALHRRSRWRRGRSDRGCGGSFQRGAARVCQALCGNAPQAFPLVGPVLARGSRSGGLLELVEGVVGAPGELARDGEGGALTAAAALDGAVEVVVGAAAPAGVVGGLGERPAQLG